MYANCRNFRILKGIGVEEQDSDVKNLHCKHKFGHFGNSRMHSAFGHNYWNSSFIVDLAMGQISRSTKNIADFFYLFIYF